MFVAYMKKREEKILLILDLDETLIHATTHLIREEYACKVAHYYVYKRPYLDEFIRVCAENFKIGIWSSASDDYVREIVKQILPQDIELAFIWGRSRCTPVFLPQTDTFGYYNLDVSSHLEYTKPFKKIRRKGFDLKKVLIVEDTPAKVRNSYGNAIYIQEYKGEAEDIELYYLARYLLTLKEVANVRIIEKRGWRNSDSF